MPLSAYDTPSRSIRAARRPRLTEQHLSLRSCRCRGFVQPTGSSVRQCCLRRRGQDWCGAACNLLCPSLPLCLSDTLPPQSHLAWRSLSFTPTSGLKRSEWPFIIIPMRVCGRAEDGQGRGGGAVRSCTANRWSADMLISSVSPRAAAPGSLCGVICPADPCNRAAQVAHAQVGPRQTRGGSRWVQAGVDNQCVRTGARQPSCGE